MSADDTPPNDGHGQGSRQAVRAIIWAASRRRNMGRCRRVGSSASRLLVSQRHKINELCCLAVCRFLSPLVGKVHLFRPSRKYQC